VEAADGAFTAHLGEGAVDGGLADAGAGPLDFADPELDGETVDGVDDHFALGAMTDGDGADTLLEFAVAAEHDNAQKVFPPRDEVVAALMPVLGRGKEGIVIGSLGALDHLLKADEAADFVTGLVEEEEGEEAGGAAIAIEERMDAEEIEDVRGNEEEGFDGSGGTGLEEAGMEILHGLRGFEGREGLETEPFGAVRHKLGDLVIGVFPFPAASGGETIEVLMHLKYEGCGEGNVVCLDVDVLQDVAVTGDLLLRAVSGLGAAGDEIGDTVVGSENALDPV